MAMMLCATPMKFWSGPARVVLGQFGIHQDCLHPVVVAAGAGVIADGVTVRGHVSRSLHQV
jgi:hypothetical protein